MHEAWKDDAEDCERTFPPQGKTTLPFFHMVISSLVLFSDRCSSGQIVNYKLVVICRTFTAQSLPSMFISSILQMGGAISNRTKLLYIRFSVQSGMSGDALSC
jgi:hypothetical protein